MTPEQQAAHAQAWAAYYQQYGYPGQQGGAQQPGYSQNPYTQQQYPATQQYAQPYQQPGYGARPPFQAPPPPAMKRSPVPLIVGLVVLLFIGAGAVVTLLAGLGSASSSTGTSSGASMALPWADKIAVLEVEGVLGEGPAYTADTAWLKEQVDKWTTDSHVKGMVIRINSPGGAVSATNDLYESILRFKRAGKPVVASMGDIAASGGYYVAMAADEVYANKGTLTGSIGVILNFWGYQQLTDKIGIDFRTIKSGQFKDIGSGSREMTPEEKVLLDEMVTDVYNQFYEIVLQSRKDSAKQSLAKDSGVKPSEITDEQINSHVKGLCDGRIFSGNQAHETGMIDKIGTMDDAVTALATRLGLPADVNQVHVPIRTRGLFGKVNQQLHSLADIKPGTVKMEYRFGM